MDLNGPLIDVYAELTFDGDGIGLTLFSERKGVGPVVEQVEHFDLSEIEGKAGDHEYLRLGENAVSLLRDEDTSQETITTKTGPSLPEVGDMAVDQSPPHWSDNPRVRVTDVLANCQARDWSVSRSMAMSHNLQSPAEESVADKNPDYPATDPVVLAEYVNGNGTEYAFPASRLREPEGLGQLFKD